MALLDDIRSQYPWLDVIGLGDFVVSMLREGVTIDEAVAKVRTTSQYKARFPGILNNDGTRRFGTESDYIDWESRVRQVLVDFNAYNPNQDSPQDYLAFLDMGADPQQIPEQLSQRFQVYRALERGSQELRDAFYIYGGLNVSVDDLYQAVVSPEFRQRMVSTYDETVAKQNLDYETYITRATERGLERVSETLRNMQSLGLVSGAAVSQMLNIDPAFAREMMGSLFQTSGVDTRTLSVDELLSSFDYAMIGSAALETGFSLPTPERLEEYRSAGVDRARALRGYQTAALRRAGLEAMADRFNAKPVTEETLADAFVAGDARSAADVTRMFAQEAALGQAQAGFGRNLEGSRVTQTGRRSTGGGVRYA